MASYTLLYNRAIKSLGRLTGMDGTAAKHENKEARMRSGILPLGKAWLALCLLLPTPSMAQSDFGVWADAAVEKKINKKWSVDVGAEWRSRDDLGKTDRWSFGFSGEYKPIKGLKLGAGYDLLVDNNERISYHDDPNEAGQANYGQPNKRADFWGTRHRFHFDATGSMKLGRWSLSLRERWQYTYRPEKTVNERYDYDDDEMDGKPKTYRGKGKNVLRSRLQVEYDIKGLPVEPYANAEMYNAWNVEKMRYTVGADWKITKKHVVGLCYRFQKVYNNDDDFEPDRHIIGLSYKFKF